MSLLHKSTAKWHQQNYPDITTINNDSTLAIIQWPIKGEDKLKIKQPYRFVAGRN